MTQSKSKLNSSYAFIIAVINTILVYIYLFKFGEVSENEYFNFSILLLFIISLQLGFISYFDKTPTKKMYKTLTIIFFVLFILLSVGVLMLNSYASGFNH